MIMCVAVTGLRRGLVLLLTGPTSFLQTFYCGTVPVTTHPPVITAELLRHVCSTPTKPPQLQLSCAQRREEWKYLMEICQTNLQLWQLYSSSNKNIPHASVGERLRPEKQQNLQLHSHQASVHSRQTQLHLLEKLQTNQRFTTFNCPHTYDLFLWHWPPRGCRARLWIIDRWLIDLWSHVYEKERRSSFQHLNGDVFEQGQILNAYLFLPHSTAVMRPWSHSHKYLDNISFTFELHSKCDIKGQNLVLI